METANAFLQMAMLCFHRKGNFKGGDSFEVSLLLLVTPWCIGTIALFCPIKKLHSQNCDYVPGNISLQEGTSTINDFYQLKYCIVNTDNQDIIQVQSTPDFNNLTKGNYEAYSIVYKKRDSIINLETGKQLMEVTSACFQLSVPLSFSVCATPEIHNIDTDTFKICGNGEKRIIADAIQVTDLDGTLDTFSIAITILTGEIGKDSLEIDLTTYPQVQAIFSNLTLTVEQIPSLSIVEDLLANISFYTFSNNKDIRTLEIKILDGINESNSLYRHIEICPLPSKPTWNFTNEDDR